MTSHWYVGLAKGTRELFRSVSTPREGMFPQYLAVIGPFRTKRGAEFMRDHGANNPHCRDVNEAERLARHA